jgi:hypothetical protein
VGIAVEVGVGVGVGVAVGVADLVGVEVPATVKTSPDSVPV